MHVHAGSPGAWNVSRSFALGMFLNLLFVAAEVIFGLRAHSLALLSDAGHNLSDVLGLSLAWGAALLARRPPTTRHTYGLRRASILAAMGNAVLLLLAVGGISWEAIERIGRPHAVATDTVILVAAIGILINGLTALLFLSGRKRDLNIQGAFLHMLADAGVSAGVVLAAVVIRATGWMVLDPIVSLAVGVAIIWGTWGLSRKSLLLAMDAVPEGTDLPAITRYLQELPGVTVVHDLHVWGMSTTETALTVHLVKPDASVDDAFLSRISRELHHRFGIEHATIQLECADTDCDRASTGAV